MKTQSGGYGHVVQKSIALAYLPPQLINDGVKIEIFGERRPTTLTTQALYDPSGAKMRVR